MTGSRGGGSVPIRGRISAPVPPRIPTTLPTISRPPRDHLATMWSGLSKVLILFKKLLIFAVASSTTFWSLRLNLLSVGVGDGREGVASVDWSAMIGPAVAVVLLAIAAHYLVDCWHKGAFAGVVICTMICAFFFIYNFQAAFQSAVTTREGSRQAAAEKVSGSDRRSKREAEIDADLTKLRLQLDRGETAETIQAEIEREQTANGAIFLRSRKCEPGFVASKDGLSELLCDRLGKLRTRLTIAQRVDRLIEERKGSWAETTKVEDAKGKVDPRTKYMQILKTEIWGTKEERDKLDPADVAIMWAALWEALAAELAAMIGPTLMIRALESFFGMAATRHIVQEKAALPDLAPPPPAKPKARTRAVEKAQVPALSTEVQWLAARTFRSAEASPKASEVQADCKRWCEERGFELPKQWTARLKEHLIAAGFPPHSDGRNVRYPGLGLRPIGAKLTVVSVDAPSNRSDASAPR